MSGLCVITDAAGRRLPPVRKQAREPGANKGRARRPAKGQQAS